MNYDIIATTTFGIESITANELKELGYEDLKVENGRVTFSGDEMDIAIANVWLRTAERVIIKIAEFKATSFDTLFDETEKIEWGDIIPVDGKMHVTGKSVRSTLFSVSDCQSIVKKAIVKAMTRKYKNSQFSEDGPIYKIDVSILKDIVCLTIDTTGEGLHKRGYREYANRAPLKETLAAAMILLSRWHPDKQLVDPMCGSGTIPIEAAMIGRNIAPGMKRRFICEDWPQFDSKIFKQVKEGAKKAINDKEFRILASDIDFRALKVARDNAKKAGVENEIAFQTLAMQDFSSKKKTGIIVTNPPYGERMGEEKEIRQLYKDLGVLAKKLEFWSFNIITSYEDFENCFGEKASKNRKLYNGMLKCYLYQYIRKYKDDKIKKEDDESNCKNEINNI